MLEMKRPGTGLSSDYLDRIIGRKAKKDIHFDELSSLEFIE